MQVRQADSQGRGLLVGICWHLSTASSSAPNDARQLSNTPPGEYTRPYDLLCPPHPHKSPMSEIHAHLLTHTLTHSHAHSDAHAHARSFACAYRLATLHYRSCYLRCQPSSVRVSDTACLPPPSHPYVWRRHPPPPCSNYQAARRPPSHTSRRKFLPFSVPRRHARPSSLLRLPVRRGHHPRVLHPRLLTRSLRLATSRLATKAQPLLRLLMHSFHRVLPRRAQVQIACCRPYSPLMPNALGVHRALLFRACLYPCTCCSHSTSPYSTLHPSSLAVPDRNTRKRESGLESHGYEVIFSTQADALGCCATSGCVAAWRSPPGSDIAVHWSTVRQDCCC